MTTAGCLLETTAQIFRLLNKGSFSHSIQDSVSQFDEVGTTHFVLKEFENVACKLYDQVVAAFDDLPDQNRPQPFGDLWSEVSYQLGVYIPGGGKLLSVFAASLAEKFGARLVTPRTVSNYVRGARVVLYESFFLIGNIDLRRSGNIFDCSTCCAWKTQSCKSSPGPLCRLKITCLDRREEFLSSVETLSSASRHESRWLREHLNQLRGLSALELMAAVAEKPNNFGDLLIFWETPANWCILTGDKSFDLLRKMHRSDLAVWHIRPLRRSIWEKCTVSKNGAQDSVAGILENYSFKGGAIRVMKQIAKKGDLIYIESQAIGNRVGEIVREADEGLFYGVRFKRPQSRS